MLIAYTYLPGFVTMVFRGMPTVWSVADEPEHAQDGTLPTVADVCGADAASDLRTPTNEQQDNELTPKCGVTSG